MGGGGHHTKTKTVNNEVNENIYNESNNVKNIDNIYNEHNIETKIQNGDRVLGGDILIKDDVNAGTAYYKMNLQNLNMFDQMNKYANRGSQLYDQVAPTVNQVWEGVDPASYQNYQPGVSRGIATA